MAKNQSNKLFESSLVKEALKQSFVKLNPRIMLRNPVMFTVEIGTAIMLIVCVWIYAGEKSQGSFAYNFAIFLILFITVLFANFAEAIAEARGKAQANSLRKTREETPAKWIQPVGEIFTDEIKIIPSSQLKKEMYFFAKPEIRFPWMEKLLKGLPPLMKVQLPVNPPR